MSEPKKMSDREKQTLIVDYLGLYERNPPMALLKYWRYRTIIGVYWRTTVCHAHATS